MRTDARSEEGSLDEQVVLSRTYEWLLRLWTSGVRDYHSLLSAYLTANSIFVAVIGLLVSRESVSLLFALLILLLSCFGILITLQMAILLGRFSAQNSLWEWQLRGLEGRDGWQGQKLLTALHRLKEKQEVLEDPWSEPSTFYPNWALRRHRQWWAHRAVSFPWFFGLVYGLFLIWSLMQLPGL